MRSQLFAFATVSIVTGLSLVAWALFRQIPGATFAASIRVALIDHAWEVGGWPALAAYVAAGFLMSGPPLVRYCNGHFFQRPVVSGTNLWVGLGMFYMALMSLTGMSQICSHVAVWGAFVSMWLVGVFLRIVIVPIALALIAFRASKRGVRFRDITIKTVDDFGIAFAFLSYLVAIWQLIAFYLFGIHL